MKEHREYDKMVDNMIIQSSSRGIIVDIESLPLFNDPFINIWEIKKNNKKLLLLC